MFHCLLTSNIMVNSRFRNAVKSVKMYPGADVGSDHVPVVMNIRLRLKKLASGRKTIRRNLEILRDEDIRQTFSIKVNNRYEELMCEEPMQLEDDQMIESVWKSLKSRIEEVVEEMIPKRPKEKKQKWMTDEIMQLMKERRSKKNDKKEYRRIDKEIRTKCKIAKEQWFGNRCAEIEDLERKHHSRRLHEEVKRLTDRKSSVKTSSGCISNKDGTLLFEKDDIEKRWVEYISELYKDDERGQIVEYIGGGPEITEQEVIKARKKMKDKKAAGMDGINTEIIKALDGASLRTLTK